MKADIQCRFPSEGHEIRCLGNYLKNVTTLKFKPHFIIREMGSTETPQEITIPFSVIDVMMTNASFKLETVQIPVLNDLAIISISLSLSPEEAFPISGFPRKLLSQKGTKGRFASSSELAHTDKIGLIDSSAAHQEFAKNPGLRHVTRHSGLGDDAGSFSSESSGTAFPEIQRLPKGAKLAIWQFLHERIEALNGRGEEVPAKIQLIERACEVDDDENSEDPNIESYSNVLHIACIIGNHWIVELQIRAHVDITILDGHGWTALAVAKAQGHKTCVRLLYDYRDANRLKVTSHYRSPSHLVKCSPECPIQIESNGLMAYPSTRRYSYIRKRLQIRSNHPIPRSDESFYFEMTVLRVSKLG